MIELPIRLTERRLSTIFVTLLAMETAIALLNFVPTPHVAIHRQWMLDREANFPVWLMSAQLLVAAVAAEMLARRTDSAPARRTGWRLTAALMLYLSIDETAAIHETLGGDIARRLHLDIWPDHSWLFIFAPLIALGVAVLVWVVVRGLRNDRRAVHYGTAGLAFWLASLSAEAARGLLLAAGSDPSVSGTAVLPVIEEWWEMLGTTCFGMAFMLRLRPPTPV